MMNDTQHQFFTLLNAPFEPDQVKVRTQSGRALHYITAPTVMNRLDDVCGPTGWWVDAEPFREGTKCSLTIQVPGEDPITKCGIGGVTEMHDPSDTEKTGFSDALKRAAVLFGIGRYLYRDGVPGYLGDQPPPPEPPRGQPAPPRPAPQAQPQRPAPQQARPQGGGGSGFDDWKPPRMNKGVYPWLKFVDATFGGALKTSNEIAKGIGAPWKSNEWDDMQVEEVCWGLIDAIKTWDGYQGEFDHLTDPRLGN